MVCTDRQLAQSQRELGFSTRAGVVNQLRPFSGKPTAEALADYINRELLKVIQPMRNKVNDVYLPVAEMAPSANPLHYFFSENTASADPTTGFIRLNQAVQNTATVIRVSELNTRAISAAAWLDVMQGSATVPLGVVTLTDAADPGRFIRFDLGSMTDNGAYWDLNVTVIESSHPNPFVQGESVSIGFIAGVAAGTIAPAPGVPGIRAISAGTQSASSGTIIFANSNGFSFGFSGSSQITASFAALKTLSLATYPTTISSNFSLNVGSSFSGDPIVFQLAGTDGSLYRRANVFWRLSSGSMVGIAPIQVEAGPGLLSAQHISFSVGSGLTWGVTSTLDAIFGRIVQITGSANDKSLAVASHIGGNVVSSMSQLAFSNASGLTFSLSTAANAATLLGSVNDQSVAVVSHVGGNVVSSATRLAFSNASGLTFSLSTAASGATLLGSVNDQSIAVLSHVGGNAVSSATRLAFSNASGLTFSLSTAAGGATLLGSVNDQSLGIVSHVGGNVVSSVTRLAFSNASNVTFSLSTAAGAATLFASVNAGGGGGIAINIDSNSTGGTSEMTSGTVRFGHGASQLTNAFQSFSINNVAFSWDSGANSTVVLGHALMRITANLTTTGGFGVSKMEFRDSNGVSWGVATSNDAEGRGVQVTAKMADLTYLNNFPGERSPVNLVLPVNLSTSGWVFPLNMGLPMHGNMTIGTVDILLNGLGFTSTQSTGSLAYTLRGGLYSLANSTQLTRINSFSSTFSTTTQSFSARNLAYNANKAFTVHSSVWSAQPVLSAGVNYWMQLNFSSAAISVLNAFVGAEWGGNAAAGIWAATSTSRVNMVPFCGLISNVTTPGASIGTAAFGTFSVANPMPQIQFRDGIALF